MLTEIFCKYFKNDHMVHFHDGLNVVLGSSTGTTSIGKSTMLLIIDYVFGGSTYASSDAVRELSNHYIKFTFQFGGKDYHFARPTDDRNIIYKISSMDATIQKDDCIPLKQYISWLSKHYQMDFSGMHFRDTISRFFRVYGKKNYNEQEPLKIREAEKSSHSIDILITLFKYHDEIAFYKQQLENLKEQQNTFRKAKNYKYISSDITTVKKYNEAQKKLSALVEKRNKLITSSNVKINHQEAEKADRINELKLLLDEKRLCIHKEKLDLHLIDTNLQLGMQPTEADLKKLLTFFKNANLEELTKIENFHHKIQAILKPELQAERKSICANIKKLQTDINDIQTKLEALSPSMAYSHEFLTLYSSIEKEIDNLKSSCSLYLEADRLKRAVKHANSQLDTHITGILNTIEKKINLKMEDISDYISSAEDNAPILRLLKDNKYTFRTPRDTGTGTNFKGMLIYDLSILQLTVLPAIAHDSLLFRDISDADLKKLLKVYAFIKGKQIFIAFDHQNSYGPEITTLLNQHMVIKLDSNKEALFGRQWGKKANKN